MLKCCTKYSIIHILCTAFIWKDLIWTDASMVHEIQPNPLQKTGYLGHQYFKIRFIFPFKLLIRVRDNLQRALTAVGFIRLVLTVWFPVTPPFLHDTFSIWHTCVLVWCTTVYIFKMSPYKYDIHFPVHLFIC